MLDTYVFRIFGGLIGALWSTPVGQIFLLTASTYFICYMIYSGYLSWFYGGVGAPLLSQVGFTAIDFLGLIPMTILLIGKLLISIAEYFIKQIFIYIFLPFVLFSIIFGLMNFFDVYIFPDNAILASLGIFSWMIGYGIGFSPKRYERKYYIASLVLCFLGATMLALSMPWNISSASSSNDVDQFSSVMKGLSLEIVSAAIIIFFVLCTYLLGLFMASSMVEEKQLSNVEKITLKEDLELLGPPEFKQTGLFFWETPPKPKVYTYKVKREEPVYLIGTFSKTTAFYFPSETTNAKKGKLVVISNDVIYSMEITGSSILNY